MINKLNWKRNIALFLFGQGLTLFGSMLVHYAIMWHITLQTQSGVMMTLITVAGALPMFFISPFGGVWADRYNKKHVINIADSAIAAITLVMAVLFSFDYEFNWLLLVCLATRALGQGVQMPAVSALIPELVPEEHLTRVNGISGGLQSLIMFGSPMAGAALLAFAPIQTLMYIDVVTAAIGISILFFLVKVPVLAREKEIKPGAKQYFVEIKEGLRYIAGDSFLKRFLVLGAVFSIMLAPASIMTPLQVARNYGDDIWTLFGNFALGAEQRLAAIEVAFFAGMSLGGLLIGAWGGFRNKCRSMMAGIILQGVFVVCLGTVGNFWIYSSCMLLTGIVIPMSNAPMMATLQSYTDPAYMGRVFSVLMMMSSLMMPLGMVFWGPLGDIIDIGWILVGTGIFIFLLGAVFIFDKTILKAGEPKETTQSINSKSSV